MRDSDKLFVLGDFNGHLGHKRAPWDLYLGPFGDTEKGSNNNGEHLLNICAEHDLLIANTFYQHRKSQITTWYKWNDLSQTSQIDFILTRRQQRWEIKDAKAVPNAIIDTDHIPVILCCFRPVRKHSKAKKQTTIINTKKLQEKEIQDKVNNVVSSAYSKMKPANNIEEDWAKFKDTIITAVSENCGVRSTGQSRQKRTLWWNEEVKLSVKNKKKMFKIWQKSNLEEDYIKYSGQKRM